MVKLKDLKNKKVCIKLEVEKESPIKNINREIRERSKIFSGEDFSLD